MSNSSAPVQDIQLSSFPASPDKGFRIIGQAGYGVGWVITLAGDINGDRVPDLIVTAREALTLTGIVYMIFGNRTHEGNIYLNTLTETGATVGYRIIGAGDDDWCGWSVAGLGDINNDGYSDIALSSSYYNDRALVILGRATWAYQDMDLNDWDTMYSSFGFRLLKGFNTVSSAGDVNGDGYNDILCAYLYENPGMVYVLYGHSNSQPFDDINLDDLIPNEMIGFRILGAVDGDEVGFSLSSVGDYNDDGYDDFIVGAPSAFNKGAAYIFALPWDRAVSAHTNGQTNGVVVSAHVARSGIAYSEISVCTHSESLFCSALELTDTTFVAAVSVPYVKQIAYMGQYNALPSISIAELSTSGTVSKVRSYVYTPSAVRSVKLTHLTSVRNFGGVFLAGTGTIASNGATVPL
eukprot:gene7512-9009_t